ncbi:TPA: hypothetical protein VJ340_001233 [Streptococcus pyogenes]|nr:hypothetical protein [Streptococcus pyogenes]
MTEIEKISEELSEYDVPDELIGKIENLIATLYGEKLRAEKEFADLKNLWLWEKYPEPGH